MTKEERWYRQLKFYFQQLLNAGANKADGNRFIVEALESRQSQYYFRARTFLLELAEKGELTAILVWLKSTGATEDLPPELIDEFI